MEYLTYEEYLSLGGIYDETAFNRNIDRACATIDRYTQSRVSKMLTVPRRVKALCRDLVECYAVHLSNAGNDIASHSQSAGTVNESVTYVTKSAEEVESEIQEMIYDHLWEITDDYGTPLLYKGV